MVGVLTEQKTIDGARNYWKVLKNRLKKEGSELVTNCNQLKMVSQDGKRRMTDVATTEQLLRLIQSIPSKKAEPFKLWLAQVGRERIEETIDPELTKVEEPDGLEELLVLRDISDALMQRIEMDYRVIISFNTMLIILGAMGIIAPATSAMLHNLSTIGISLYNMTDLIRE